MSVNDTKYHHLSFSSLYHWESKMKGKWGEKKQRDQKYDQILIIGDITTVNSLILLSKVTLKNKNTK